MMPCSGKSVKGNVVVDVGRNSCELEKWTASGPKQGTHQISISSEARDEPFSCFLPPRKGSPGCSYSPQLVQILAPFFTRLTYYSGTQWEIWSFLIGEAVHDEPSRPMANDQVYLIPDIHLLQSSSQICEIPARSSQLFSISLLVKVARSPRSTSSDIRHGADDMFVHVR